MFHPLLTYETERKRLTSSKGGTDGSTANHLPVSKILEEEGEINMTIIFKGIYMKTCEYISISPSVILMT